MRERVQRGWNTRERAARDRARRGGLAETLPARGEEEGQRPLVAGEMPRRALAAFVETFGPVILAHRFARDRLVKRAPREVSEVAGTRVPLSGEGLPIGVAALLAQFVFAHRLRVKRARHGLDSFGDGAEVALLLFVHHALAEFGLFVIGVHVPPEVLRRRGVFREKFVFVLFGEANDGAVFVHVFPTLEEFVIHRSYLRLMPSRPFTPLSVCAGAVGACSCFFGAAGAAGAVGAVSVFPLRGSIALKSA